MVNLDADPADPEVCSRLREWVHTAGWPPGTVAPFRVYEQLQDEPWHTVGPAHDLVTSALDYVCEVMSVGPPGRMVSVCDAWGVEIMPYAELEDRYLQRGRQVAEPSRPRPLSLAGWED